MPGPSVPTGLMAVPRADIVTEISMPVTLTGTVRNAAGATSAPASAIVNPFSITPGVEFAANAWCYQRLAANAPLDPNSANIVQTLRTAVTPSGALYNNMAIPIWRPPANQPTVAVAFFTVNPDGMSTRRVLVGENPWTDQLMQQFSAVPIPDGFHPSGGTDAEAVIYQSDTHKYWEGWIFDKTGLQVRNSAGVLVDEWSVRWGGYLADIRTSDGTGSPQPPSGVKPFVSASGIPAIAFAITLGDLKNQAINHPVGLTIPTGSARSDVWSNPPAWRCDGYPPQTGPNQPAEGCIFRLPANLNLNNYSSTAWDGVSVKTMPRLVAEAMQNYGMVAHDQGGGWVMDGEEQSVYGPGDIISNDPILSQVMGAPHPWGYDNQALQQVTDPAFPWDQLQLLQMHLVSS